MYTNATYAVADQNGDQLSCGFASYGEALQAAKRAMSAHEDISHVRIYKDVRDGEGWDLSRDEVLYG